MDLAGRVDEFEAQGLDEITGPNACPPSAGQIRMLFSRLIRCKDLIGPDVVDYPEKVMRAKEVGDLWLYKNRFGRCLRGYHPWIVGEQLKATQIYSLINTLYVNRIVRDSFSIPTCSKFLIKKEENAKEACAKPRNEKGITLITSSMKEMRKCSVAEMVDFFKVESLATTIKPKCGSCRCGKCPVPGSRFSHREEAELKLVEEGLLCNETRSCWVTKYPYLHLRELLQGSKDVAMKSMLATECSLQKDEIGHESIKSKYMIC